MLERLVIRGLGVIDDATIEFSPGLTAITGETGAGKTMVLTGLALLAGAKADAGLVRRGVTQAGVEAEWTVDPAGAAAARLTEAGADLEDDGRRVIIARSIAAEGRSRAVAGGRSVPVGVLAEVADQLLAVHGQAEQMRLRSADAQRAVVDRFGGCLPALADHRAAHAAWRTAVRDLRRLEEEREARERESAMLTHALAEIDAISPTAGEDADLDRQASVLQHAGGLLIDLSAAHEALIESDDASDAHAVLLRALQALERAVSVDAALESLAARLRTIVQDLPDLALDIASASSAIEADPGRQAWVEERRAALTGLKRKYGSSLDEVLAWADQARATVGDVAGTDERVAALRRSVAEGEAAVQELAAVLTAQRRAAAEELGRAVTAELQALAMPDAELAVAVRTADDVQDYTADGADTIEILLRPHRGSDLRSIAKGASGGELSRVMLALEVALAGADPVPTFVFDEVDAGIGGRAAVEVGRRLAHLAETAQVIVVTHLPQVAAFADRQVVVTKDASGAITASSTRMVQDRERVDELVRMLSGLEATEAGAAHAEELLAAAAADGTDRANRNGDGVARGTKRPRVTKSARPAR